MATPRRGALHTDADNRAELQRPRLKRPVTVARHAEVLTGHDPTARIDDYRRQRALVRIDPDHVARPVGREQRARRTRTGPHTPAMSAHRVPSSSRCCAIRFKRNRSTKSRWGSTSNTINVGKRSYQVRPVPESTDRGRHF